MSRHLLAFLLSELSIVRLICHGPNCGAIVEIPIERLRHQVHRECPVCKQSFDPTKSGDSALQQLAVAIERLQQLSKVVDLEFVLPAESERKPTP